jgi:tripartite-type tricarboxylate transporter receptor subunit TctC
MAGQVQLLFSSTVSSLPHVKNGKVRALAVTSLKRPAALPYVPTIAESGFPGFESSSWFGILVPAKTSQPVITRLLSDTRTALKSAEVNDGLVSQGAEPGGSSSAEFGAYFQAELRKWAKVAKSSDQMNK